MQRWVKGFLAAAAVISTSTTTFASERDGGASIELLAGYGISGDANVLGPGLGLRTGYTFDVGLYTGILGLAHLGSSDPGEPDVRHHAQSVRGELGYAFSLPVLTLRPSLRAGVAFVTTTRDVDDGFTSPDLGIGVTLLVPIGSFLLGADVEGRIFTRLVDNGDNFYQITTLGAYAVAGYVF
jgi:hypothetical protein